MDHSAVRDAIAAEETALRGFPLDHASLFGLAQDLVAASPAPLSVKIVVGRRTVVQLAMDGTAEDNARFLDLKLNTVFNTGHSSLWWHHQLRVTGRQLKDVIWASPQEVIDFGGGVPLFAGPALVGAVAVSGLPHEEDHRLIVAAMTARMAG
ncbi:heme-binding protein [Gemmobacter sp.]|uniref:heme-binding protein n=1 Tax=Gemmobacter sp. TaxID=1898957 RepID=UPI002AFE1B76|nr:heme-binding protein [Gemmobacter sp.]